MRGSIVLVFGLFVASCSGAKTQNKQLPDGSWQVTCKSSTETCIERARSLCGDLGARVLGAGAKDEIYGVPGNQVRQERAEVIVACGTQTKPAPATPPPASPATATSRACTPGSTQRCVGPGACEGGQACLPDGSAFGPCDCGPSPAGAE